MKKLALYLLILTLLAACTGCSGALQSSSSGNTSSSKIITEDLSSYFEGFDGCFVLLDKNSSEYKVYNTEKSQKQVPPCSSFKIYNSLIGLETKVVEDENTVFEWDGTKNSIDSWNRDHSMKTAIENSVVWYYQKLASLVGEEKMQEYLDKMGYGNKDISGGITKFWLQSSLKISPREQVDMLRRFYEYDLPFSKRNIDIVKKIIVLSESNGAVLSGKTGSGVSPDGSYINGWFVGYVEKDGNVYIFAANIEPEGDSSKSASGQIAKDIATKILKDKGLI
jgi:bla regulator protein BlaR1